MAHFAEIDENNIVIRVLVTDDYEEKRGQRFLAEEIGLGGKWLKTSYNTVGGKHIYGGEPFRKNYAGTGYNYDAERDAFIPPKPFESWILNEETCLWNPPKPCPNDGKLYEWSEDIKDWIL